VIEESATVVGLEADFALVETQAKAACGSCESQSSCGTSVLSGLFKRRHNLLRVRNSLQLKPGDRVVIGMREGALVNVSFVAYLLPLVCLILAAIAGREAGRFWGWPGGELISVAGGLFGLIAGLLLLKKFSLRKQYDPDYEVVMLRREYLDPEHSFKLPISGVHR
jgi:sigma-E factor negative regulatory protein RseC